MHSIVKEENKNNLKRKESVTDCHSISKYEQQSDCGLLALRPNFLKRFATIQMFVLASCILVTLQQALSSGYFNSVITTIEKRFDVPSRLTGAMASTFEVGNLITIIFVSYFGTHRHIPVWIGKGVLITGLGSLLFAIPHFIHDGKPPLVVNTNLTLNNMCRAPQPEIQNSLISHASHFINMIAPEKDPRFCNEGGTYKTPHLFVFMIAMVLIGSGGTPIFTLGTIYIDDHVRKEDSAMYIGCMYSMVAFGLMIGFLLGGYFITVHENSFGSGHVPENIYNGHPKWIGAWWAGFVLLGLLLILISVVFFAFPRSLRKDKKRKRIAELEKALSNQCITITTEEQCKSNEQNSLFRNNKCLEGNENCTFLTNTNTSLNGNNNLATSTTTKLHLSISPNLNSNHYATSMNCTSSLVLSDQAKQQNNSPQTIKCSATASISIAQCPTTIKPNYVHYRYHHLHHFNQAKENEFEENNQLIEHFNTNKNDSLKSNNLNSTLDTESTSETCSSVCLHSSERKLKDIPKCMLTLLCNPIYIVTCLASCMELCIVSGFLVFLPKYLETQFTISKSQANLFTGGIAVPGACVGIFLGGYLLKKFQLKPKDAIQFVLFFNLVCMGLYTALYFLGCDNPKMAGATHSYFNSSHLDTFQVNLNSECNKRCGCSPNDIEPVCGLNAITYFSPCHAGCRINSGLKHTQSYSNCSCIHAHWPANGLNNINKLSSNDNFTINNSKLRLPLNEATATNGPCVQNCKSMIWFLILLFIVTLVVSITQMPLLMVILRSVQEDERAFALGMQFVLFRLFGYIPSPILFGHVIDSTCLLWKANCGRQGGFCLIYNIEHFRLRYVGVCSALKVAAGLLFFLDWLLICYQNRLDSNQPVRLTIDEVVNSIYAIDQQQTKETNCDKKDENILDNLKNLSENLSLDLI